MAEGEVETAAPGPLKCTLLCKVMLNLVSSVVLSSISSSPSRRLASVHSLVEIGRGTSALGKRSPTPAFGLPSFLSSVPLASWAPSLILTCPRLVLFVFIPTYLANLTSQLEDVNNLLTIKPALRDAESMRAICSRLRNDLTLISVEQNSHRTQRSGANSCRYTINSSSRTFCGSSSRIASSRSPVLPGLWVRRGRASRQSESSFPSRVL